MTTTIVLCAAALISSDPAAQSSKTTDLKLRQVERNLIHFTNLERKRNGLPELEVDRELMHSARHHTAWMARSRTLRHTTHPVAENIAMGQSCSREAVRSWMSSVGHRANILNRGHRRVGVAAYRTARGTIFWCQQFCR
jgi:uncharacterized protein YkwD